MSEPTTSNRAVAVVVAVFVVLALVAMALTTHWGAGPATVPGAMARPRVVATFSILGDLVHQVAGDNVELLVLVGPDGDAHAFEPTSSDAMTVADASLIFENGLGFENWLDKLLRSSGTKAQRVDVSEGITAHRMEDPNATATSPAGKTQEAGETDPHAWHDVRNVILMVGHISDALAKADSIHADEYKANAAAYVEKLRALDAQIVAAVDSLPQSKRKLVTTHDALGYYARRYGFVILGSGLDSISTESGDPSAKEMIELIGRIKSSGVPTIFLENIQNAKLMEQIASEAHVKIGPPLFTDALGKPGGPGDSYLKLMRYNTEAIVTGLKP